MVIIAAKVMSSPNFLKSLKFATEGEEIMKKDGSYGPSPVITCTSPL